MSEQSDNVFSIIDYARSHPVVQAALRAMLEMLALRKGGFLEPRKNENSAPHVLLTRALSRARERYPFVDDLDAFSKLSGSLEDASPKLLRQLLEQAEALERFVRLGDPTPFGLFLRELDASEEWVAPKSLSDFLFEIAAPKKGETLYLPYLGSPQLLIRALSNRVEPVVEDPYELSVSVLVLMTFGRMDISMNSAEPLVGSEFLNFPESARVAISFPPELEDEDESTPALGGRHDTREAPLSLNRRMLRAMANTSLRRALVVVPQSILHSATVADRLLRRELIESGAIEAIIKLPNGALMGEGGGSAVFVLSGENRAKRREIRFLDASHPDHITAGKRGAPPEISGAAKLIKAFNSRGEILGVSKNVPISEILEQDGNLAVDRYLRTSVTRAPSDWETERLADVAEILRPMPVKALDTGDPSSVVQEISLSDLDPDGIVTTPKKRFFLSSPDLAKAHRVALKQDDILLVIKGGVGRVGFLNSSPETVWIPNQSFVIVRSRSADSNFAKYLFRYLASPTGQAEIAAYVAGALVKHLPANDIRLLEVLVPPPAELKRIAREHDEIVDIGRTVSELQSKAREKAASLWKNLEH